MDDRQQGDDGDRAKKGFHRGDEAVYPGVGVGVEKIFGHDVGEDENGGGHDGDGNQRLRAPGKTVERENLRDGGGEAKTEVRFWSTSRPSKA